MSSLIRHIAVLLFFWALGSHGSAIPNRAPTVTVLNGTYVGVNNPKYGTDQFLGIPYAQPPLGSLRFQLAASLNSTFSAQREATSYGPQCIGYGVRLPFCYICVELLLTEPRLTSSGMSSQRIA